MHHERVLFSLAVAALCAAAPVPAQSQTFTTPNGYDMTEGNAIFFHWSGSRRMQVLDNTNRTAVVPLLKQVAFRRDASGGGNTSTARSFPVEFSVGYHVWGNASCTFDNNYKPGTKQTVYTQKSTNIPDWTQVPAPAPGPWDLVLMFDTPFTYIPTEALLWDLVLLNASAGGSMDRHYVAYEASSGSSSLGAGCTTASQTSPSGLSLSFLNNGTAGLALRPSLSRTAPGAPAYLGIDAVASNLTLPGLCGILYVNPVLVVPLGTTTATGSLSAPEIRVPPNPLLVGAPLYCQGLIPDASQPGIPVQLSEGRTGTFPVTPAPGIECIYLWMALPATSATFAFTGGAPLAQFSN